MLIYNMSVLKLIYAPFPIHDAYPILLQLLIVKSVSFLIEGLGLSQ